MLGRLQGETVYITVKTKTGKDPYNNDIYSETEEAVENVLWVVSSADDVKNSVSMYGKRANVTLGIPKGDTHDWDNVKVRIPSFCTVQTFGLPITGIQNLIPMSWGMNVYAEIYK